MIMLMQLGYLRTFLDIRQFITYTTVKDSFEEIYKLFKQLQKKILTFYASFSESLIVKRYYNNHFIIYIYIYIYIYIFQSTQLYNKSIG